MPFSSTAAQKNFRAQQVCALEFLLLQGRLPLRIILWHCRAVPAATRLIASMHLSALYIYPVKSLRGCAVAAADVDDLGLVGDRRFMVIDATSGTFLTQRTIPRMARIATGLGP